MTADFWDLARAACQKLKDRFATRASAATDPNARLQDVNLV
jgi:hypothetical protein